MTIGLAQIKFFVCFLNFLNAVALVSVLGRQEGFFCLFLNGQQAALHLETVTNVSVNHALFFGFTELPLLPMSGFHKIFRTGISNVLLMYFLLSKHIPLKIVFVAQNISSLCVPRSSTRTQMPCLKHHCLPSLLQSIQNPI